MLRWRLVDWVILWAAVVCGLLLRLWFLKSIFAANGDTLIYGDIAANLLTRGKYAVTSLDGVLHSTLIRLPGYPYFLALCFSIFGKGNYVAVAFVQIVLDLLTALLIGDTARRLAPPPMRRIALQGTVWLAMVCPFTAAYAVIPLTEGPTLFSIALAMWAATCLAQKPRWTSALTLTLALVWAALLRPDGVLISVVLVPALLLQLKGNFTPKVLRIVTVSIVLGVIPFVAWTWRNFEIFHVFQPLVPKSATDPGEPVYGGWERWVKTWSLDFATTYSIYWEVQGEKLDIDLLPSRAFDSDAQYRRTQALVDAYNAGGYSLNASLDAGFAKLAANRIAAHPLRYYVLLPLGRVADMWFRPRVDNLNIDLDWWVYENHPHETILSWSYALLNVLYLAAGIAGMFLRPRFWKAMLAYFLLRSALLATVAAPETRYTLECFPMLFLLGGLAIAHRWMKMRTAISAQRTM
ncbi:MAG: glycosyltransferase family 39 protein [Acidobacteriota bacterium]|nr:glycosyltransferase family 39 protein [Acidobacteriota bacterium]